MIDLQAYNNKKRVFYRSNLWWVEALDYLELRRNKPFDKIDIQLYTDDGKNAMPVDSIDDLKTIKEAQRWINKVHENVILRKYKGVRYD